MQSMFHRSSAILALGLIACMAAPSTLRAQDSHGSDVHGVVSDEQGRPLAAVVIRVPALGRSEYSHQDGSFHLEQMPLGTHLVVFERIGYGRVSLEVEVPAEGTARMVVEMVPSALKLEGFVVTGTPTARAGNEVLRPVEVLSGEELARRLQGTVAATLAAEPGMASASMGPAPARPVIRGLGGDRVLVLEDGARVGDVSGVSADHATAVDPASAQRIEVVRGPSALLYGSQALGGVINVIREEVPRTVHDGIHSGVTLQSRTVDDGWVGSANLLAGVARRVALRMEAGLRSAGDLATPEGSLENTDTETLNLAGGASWVGERGHVGAAYRYYGNDYGIPGGFVGAHPAGVDITMSRHVVKGEAQLRDVGLFSVIDGSASHTRYNHKELEPGGILGTEYGLFTTASEVRGRHEEFGPFSGGTVGARAQFERFGFGGGLSTPDSRRWTTSLYLHEEVVVEAWTIEAGARWDHAMTDVLDEDPDASIGNVRDRTFHALSGSIGVLRRLPGGVSVGVNAARAFRPPDIGELYSEGPHLASYSFEVGNPDLDTEVGQGIDLFARLERGDVRAEIAAFRNDIGGFLFPRETGEISPRTQLPIYQYSGEDAQLIGFEAAVDLVLSGPWAIDGTVSWVRGTLTEADEPLPLIPPLNGRIGLRFDTPGFFTGIETRLLADQERLGAFETPTPGSVSADLTLGLRRTLGGRLHTVTVKLENATDATVRNHLSRTKELLPEAGRGLSVVYQFVF